MTQILKNTWLIIIITLLTSCTKSYNHPDKNSLPKAADIVASVTVDQSTNTATFNFTSNGTSPMWIMSEKEIITKFNFSRYYGKKGIYKVEIKTYNIHGISDESKIIEFEIEKTDFDPKATLCADNWVIAKNIWGHIGCGESGSNGTGWWAANAGEKSNSGIYDDVITFKEDGTFEFNPGMGKTVNVNTECSFGAAHNPNDGSDFSVPTTKSTSKWELKEEGENSYLVFPENTFLSYIPNDEALANPKYKIIAIDNNTLELVIDNGKIAWHYIFIKQKYAGEVYDGSLYADKIKGDWMWEPSQQGHFGCGEPGSSGTGWYSCEPYGKEGFGLYDDIITFGDKGAYTFNPGIGGTVFVNSAYPVDGSGKEDYPMVAVTQNATYEITKEGDKYYIILPAQTMLSYIPNTDAMNSPKYRIERITENFMDLVNDNGTIAWHYRFSRTQY